MVVRRCGRRRFGQAVAAVLAAAMPLASTTAWTQPVDAASAVQSLVAQAERDTNTVRTLVHRDHLTITTQGVTVQVSSHGTEDEVGNREQDYESVQVVNHGAGAKAKSLHYTVDIIFMQGLTYFRSSLTKNKWQSRKGMSFPDPYTGGWQRGRTTVSFPKSFMFQRIGVSAGETHVRSTFKTSSSAGTADLWISAGPKPYVMREAESYHAVSGKRGSADVQIVFGPFNSHVLIQAPTTQGSA